MKKRRIISVFIAFLLVSLVAVSVIADSGYTGTVDEAQKRLEAFDGMATVEEKIQLLDSVIEYSLTVDPESEGYQGLLSSIDEREKSVAEEYLASSVSSATADEKSKALETLFAFLNSHEFSDSTEGDENFDTRLSDEVKDALALYLTESRGLTVASEKHNRLDGFKALLSIVGEEHESELITDLHSERLECAKLYLRAIGEAEGNSGVGVALRKLNYFYKNNPIADTTDGFEDFLESYNEALSSHKAAMSAALDELMKSAHVGDYYCEPIINLNFNSASNESDPRVSIGSLRAEKNIESGEEITFIGEEDGVLGDGYYTVRYDVANKHFRTVADIKGIKGSFVFEMDITTFGKLPNAAQTSIIWIENGGASVRDRNWDQVYFSINGNGDICSKATSDSVLLKDAIIPGEWIRISMVVGLDDNSIDIYADYELIASYDLKDTKYGYCFAPERVRIGTNPSIAGGQFSIDNVRLYEGYAPRRLDYFADLEPEEQFSLLVDRLYSIDSNACKKEYYEAASKLLSLYYDSESEMYNTTSPIAIAAVDKLLLFDLESLHLAISDDNLAAFESAVDTIDSFERGEETYEARSYYLEAAERVLSNAGGLITVGDSYDACKGRISEVRFELLEEERISLFVDAVYEFYHATSLEDMESYYSLANEYVEGIDTELARLSTFPNFKEAYEKYLSMDIDIGDKRAIEGAKKMLAILNFLFSYETESDWNENYELLVDYVVMVQDIISSGVYDPYYSDCASAVQRFIPMSVYFSGRIRETQIEYITSELERYDSSDVYFERFGILANLKQYIEENKVDTSSSDVMALVSRIDAGLANIEGEREKYDALVKSNTAAFIEKCGMLLGSIDYTTMKRICDEIAVYFYAMDVRDATAQDAVSVYTARCAKLEAIEEHARSFASEVKLLSLGTENVLEGVIVCSGYLKALEISVPGVYEAIEEYNAICNSYDNAASSSNSELAATRECAAYLANRAEINSFVTLITSVLCK